MRVLDIGCGTGELCRYLRHSGRTAFYTGVDVVRGAIQRAQQTHPEGRFVQADVLTMHLQESFDAVVCSGTLVSGDAIENERVRLRRLVALARAAWMHCSGYVCLVVLKQEVIRARVALGAEPALGGATRSELLRIGRELATYVYVREEVLATDRALIMSRQPIQKPIDPWAAHANVLSGRVGRFTAEIDHAWLWLEAERPDNAAAILDSGSVQRGPAVSHLRQRIAMMREDA